MQTATVAARIGGSVVTDGLIGVRTVFPLTRRYGRQALLPLSGRLTAFAEGAALDPGRAVFLDTETTGLAGGAGTVVFMVGSGRIEGDALVVEQWVLSGFAGETALLEQVAGRFRECDGVVTYNGKSFDVPLLRNRSRLAGVALPLEDRVHLDLLHPVRRAFKRLWPDCRLQTAEQELLGHTRADDLPGAEAPGAWLSLLRRGETDRLCGVLRHNAADIVALAALWAGLDAHYREASSPV